MTADCRPEEHYMVNLSQRLSEIKKLVDSGKYFTISRIKIAITTMPKQPLAKALSLYARGSFLSLLYSFLYDTAFLRQTIRRKKYRLPAPICRAIALIIDCIISSII